MDRPDDRYVLHSQSVERLLFEIEHMPRVLSRKVERKSVKRCRNGPGRVIFAMLRSTIHVALEDANDRERQRCGCIVSGADRQQQAAFVQL
jgi:hypothetical protein